VSRPTPEWLIERLAAGELPEDVAASVRARLEAEGRSPAEVLAAVETSNREILQSLPPGPVLARVRARVQPPQRAGFFLAGAVALGAAAVLAVVVTRGPIEPIGEPPLEDTTIKGDPQLIVYRQTRDGHERVRHGSTAAAGDSLQLAYRTPTEQWGVVVSLDGSGAVNLQLPPAGSSRAAPLESPREVRLPFSYHLDQAPAFERFFLVAAPEPFSPAVAIEAARALFNRGAGRTGNLELPAGFRQSSFIVLKPGGTP
jgi:hypothetical protein